MVVRRNKELVKDTPNIRPDPIFFAPKQDEIVKFIKKHPNCTRKDIYAIDDNEGHVRRNLLLLLQSGRIKETFTIT